MTHQLSLDQRDAPLPKLYVQPRNVPPQSLCPTCWSPLGFDCVWVLLETGAWAHYDCARLDLTWLDLSNEPSKTSKNKAEHIMAKLERKAGESKFFKFANIGDTIVGKFVSFTEDEPGRFGLETNLVLDTENGPVQVKCTNDLEAKIKQNLAAVEGMYLTIRYAEDKDIGKASPMKVYDIDTSAESPF